MLNMVNIIKAFGKSLFRAIGYYPARVGGLKLKCDPYHIGFWRAVSNNRWEPDTYKILSRYLNDGTVYCDIGAWIGPTALYAAKKCRRVICFEPDPVAYRYLLWNIQINCLDNAMPFNVALSDRDGLAKMGNYGEGFGDSMTSILDAGRKGGTTDVLGMTWETWMEFARPGK